MKGGDACHLSTLWILVSHRVLAVRYLFGLHAKKSEMSSCCVGGPDLSDINHHLRKSHCSLSLLGVKKSLSHAQISLPSGLGSNFLMSIHTPLTLESLPFADTLYFGIPALHSGPFPASCKLSSPFIMGSHPPPPFCLHE